jgi:hypothetical protein
MSITKPISGNVKRYKGKPTIFLNDEPINPMIYALTDTPGGRWSWEELPKRNITNFKYQGFEIFYVNIWLQDIWTKNEELDIELARKQIRGVLEVKSNAAVFLRLHINAPFWWNEENPEECTEYADGPSLPHEDNLGVSRYILGDLDRRRLHSLASMKWREDTTEKLIEFCKKLSAVPEGDSLAAIHICDGVSHEWHYWGFINHEPDCGKAMTSYFRKWLKNKYGEVENLKKYWMDANVTFENAAVPGISERNELRDGIFRDPKLERKVIDYYECQHDSIAEDIIHFCKIVKENWPRPIITGVFYGYFFFMFSRQAIGGHLAMEKVLNSPYVDYLSAPLSYWSDSRDMGGSGQARGVLESCRLHNKLWLDEMDQQTSIVKIGSIRNNSILDCDEVINYFNTTAKDDITIIRRNTAQPFSKGMGMWYFDFGPYYSGGWWDFPPYLEEIGKLKKLYDSKLHEEYKSQADVLVVYDTNCYYQFSNNWNPISDSSVDEISHALYKTGTVFDNIFLFDLDKVNLDNYKVIIFANTWMINESQKDYIKKTVASNDRVLLWNYMPGYLDGETSNIDYVSGLTGVKVERFDLSEAPKVKINCDEYPEELIEIKEKVTPLLQIVDKEAKTIGIYEGNNKAALVEKQLKSSSVIFSTIPLRNARVLKHIFKKAGVHIYSEEEDVILCGGGVLTVHTLEGGKRNIKLKSGKIVEIKLPSKSTTLFDSETGEVLIK